MSVNDQGRYPYLKDYLRFIATNMGSAMRTIECYENAIKLFYDWMIATKGQNDPRTLASQDFLDYRDHCQQQNYRNSTLQVRFAALKGLVSYLVQTRVISELNDPWPKRVRLKGEQSLPHTVPSPSEIFRLRLKPRVRLEWAWFMELALSTGMRADEIGQLVAADFDYNLRPHDKELGYTSPYFAGSIDLARGKVRTKNRMPRRVYFSQMAAKLHREFLAKHGIAPDDAITPLIAWSRSSPQGWLALLGEGVFDDPKDEEPEPEQRDRYLLEADIEALNVDAYFKKLLLKRQQSNREIEEYKLNASKPIKQRRRHLHPHALRHSFTCYMYYRNPMGERNAADSLRLLLGHGGYNELVTYLRTLNLIDNDATWKRLWLGKPQDWAGINR